ncbi:MAG TPA: GIY-YIG nuclease family protein [Chloroflexota bacterium]|nr:GIY-YIG nuclease family protein [Chloroflexota bacterium]
MTALTRDVPGSYLLVIRTRSRLDLTVGRLGPRALPRGWHVYVGRARRGLGARLARHLAAGRPVRWHVDYLRQAGQVVEVWVVRGEAALECALARAVAALPGARRCPGFGSSDCRCPGHLISFARRPPLGTLWPGLEPLPLAALQPVAPAPRARRGAGGRGGAGAGPAAL